MSDPNLTTVEDPAADCDHTNLRRGKIGETQVWRCLAPACGKLFKLKPFQIIPVFPKP